MDFLFIEQNWLFTASLVTMLGLGGLELLGLLLGGSLSAFLDGLIPDSVEAGGGLAWLHLGRVPLLAVLVLLLALFAGAGFFIQGAAHALLGDYLPGLLAIPAALAIALPATRTSAGLVGRLLPRDESYAIRAASLVGRTAVIVAGEARRGRAAEAKFQDEYGQVHYVMVEPESESVVLSAGERVLLLRQIGEARFTVAPNLISE